ncbi:MAG: class I SAM-dependent methyltransferase [Balneolaceae bacterium]|nr:class I SAM-dependent methyltransferase [Balneolaceae bacterium]
MSITFKEGDVRKLPYQSNSFDYVTILGNSFGYFETLDDDIKILKEIFRVLKRGGKVLLDIADGDYLRKNFSPRSWEWIDGKPLCVQGAIAGRR